MPGRSSSSTPAGTILDRRDEVLFVDGDAAAPSRHAPPQFRRRLDPQPQRRRRPRSIIDVEEISQRSGPGQPDRVRNLQEREREYNYELGGDYEFGLGGGRLKLIGLQPLRAQPVPPDPDPDLRRRPTPTPGQRFTQVADETETIARGEYRWRGGGADWQVSRSRARSTGSTSTTRLFELNAAGDFVPCPSPTAPRSSRRSAPRRCSPTAGRCRSNLTLQASLGGEYSQLSQSGAGGLTRTFYRPKGFLNLAWRPRPDFDLSARIERVVGQLNFFDFVASANVSGGTANAGNANLVPPQSWNGADPGDPQSRRLGHGDRAALRPADHRHRRRHPDRRERPVAGQSRRHRHASTACNGRAPSTSIRSAGAAPSST